MIIIEVALTLELVIVVLLPVSAAFPIKPTVRPEDVEAWPSHEGLVADILLRAHSIPAKSLCSRSSLEPIDGDR